MAVPNIKKIRIDQRLIHGQGAMWIANTQANLVIVANDEVAQSHIQQELMKSLVPDSVGVRFFSVDETIEKLPKAAPRQTIFLIVKSPKDVLRIAQGGIKLEHVNIGNIHYAEGKTRLTGFISIDSEDLASLKSLQSDYGVTFDTMVTPMGTERGQNFNMDEYLKTH
ncbi:PTS sugar transporter subunit IIB [Lactiplantibacillus carotarum]|uniref:PTS sugar transporter subunit IIB n=1 Tax=Lactiplantibacillus carotarum TaxID=2993456 RepID=UPI00298ED206|nr:PTS sugar transporter subunit IIB [Lactiplantibacillus carotarum]